jgi:AGZA family xanthine/uracil permease-like MFS transporter
MYVSFIYSKTHIRIWLTDQIPECLKVSFEVVIGFFLAFIGLNEAGIVVLGAPGAPVHVGNLGQTSVLLSVFCFILILFLITKKVRAIILIVIILTTFLAIITKVTPLPQAWISLPPDISPILFKLDIEGAFKWGVFSVVLTVFVMDFVDTMGTIIRV